MRANQRGARKTDNPAGSGTPTHALLEERVGRLDHRLDKISIWRGVWQNQPNRFENFMSFPVKASLNPRFAEVKRRGRGQFLNCHSPIDGLADCVKTAIGMAGGQTRQIGMGRRHPNATFSASILSNLVQKSETCLST